MTLQVDARVRRGAFTLDVDLEVAAGELLAVLGPNGAGKSTLLRAVAGLTPIADGSITLHGRDLDDGRAFVPPAQRRIGVVFQDYRLFPHLTVRDNVAFARRSVGATRAASRTAADGWLDRLGLGQLADRRPAQLSGGQAQRVALARALAGEPEALLLDEPMAALDADTRVDVRTELRSHLGDFAGPTLLVTHDPLEAMVLADRLLVLEHGRPVQTGTPAQVARRPVTPYVARLVGLNLYAGRATPAGIDLDEGGRLVCADHVDAQRVLVALRPSAITVHTAHPEGVSQRNVWPGTLMGLELLGDRARLQIAGKPGALVDVTPAAVAELELAPGRSVWLSAKATELEVYPSVDPPRGERAGDRVESTTVDSSNRGDQ